MRLYYTARELTVKIPELWALRSLGDEVIHDGSGQDTRTLIHPNGPNEWAGYANSLNIYMDLLPYVDRVWIGEGFEAGNSLGFWMVEMAGIPFGVMSETLDVRNIYRGMVYGILPR